MSSRRPPSKFVTTFAEYQWCDTCDCYHTVAKEGYWYRGPWALAHDVAPVWAAEDYQWFEDDGGIGSATSIAAENTAATVGAGSTVRLRVNVGETAGAAGTGEHSGGWTLQFSVDGGTWTTLGAATTVRYFDSTHLTNGTAIANANYVLSWSGAGTQQDWGDECEDGVSLSGNVWSKDYCEIEYTVDLNTVSNGQQVTFRMLAPDGTSTVTFTNVPTIDVAAIVAPPVRALSLGVQTPTAPVANIREPATDPLIIWTRRGLWLDGQPPTIDVTAGGDNTELPLLGELTLSGQLPTAPTAHVAAPPVGSLTITEQTPVTVVGEVELPTLDTLDLTGQTPTVVVANLREPGTDALVITEQTPVRSVGDIREPAIDELALAGIVPEAIVANVTAPDKGTLTLSGLAPTGSVGNVAIPDADALTLTEQTPTIDITVSVPVGSLTIAEQTPESIIANVAAPDVVALTLGEQTPDPILGVTVLPTLGTLTLSEQTPAAVVANVTAPDTVGLTLAEQTPTIDVAVTIPVGSLSLDEKTPERVVSRVASPAIDELALAGQTPTVVVANVSAPAIDELTLTGYEPNLGGSVTREPSTGSLTITEQTPERVVSRVAAPTTGSLTLQGYQLVDQDTIIVPVGSLTSAGETPTRPYGLLLTGYAPVGRLDFVSPSTGSLTLQGYELVDQDTVEPSAGSLTLSGQGLSLKGVMEPTTGTLTCTGYAPTLATDTLIEPSTGTLTLAGQGTTAFRPKTSSPTVGALTLSGKTPEVGGGGAVIPESGAVTLAGQAPTVQIKSWVDPTKVSLTLTGQTPTAVFTPSAPQTVEPGTGSLILESIVQVGEPDAAGIALQGQAVSIFYRDGTFIENPNATTDIPSNYEQCDYTGFRQMPGSLKLTWNKHAVRRKSWESRHPQEVLRNVPERNKGSRRPEQDDRFIEDIGTVDPEDL